jgi:chromosome segregation ATPase
MPRVRRRRREAVDWEASGTEDNLVNASEGSSNNRVDTVGVGERGDNSGNDHTTNHTNGGRSRQSTASQGIQQLSLGSWTQAVRETVQSMGATNCAIQDLQRKFESHRDELMKMDEIMCKLAVLEKECEEKDNEIVKQDNTITTLTTRNEKREANIVGREKELDRKEKELDQERVKQEKRVAAVKAEERLKLENEYNQLTQEAAQSCDKRKNELEDEYARAKVLNDRRVTALETEKQQLLHTMDEEKRRAKAHSEMLEQSTEQCDVLERAIGSVKNDMRVLEKELERIKKDFALNSQPREYLYAFNPFLT